MFLREAMSLLSTRYTAMERIVSLQVCAHTTRREHLQESACDQARLGADGEAPLELCGAVLKK